MRMRNFTEGKGFNPKKLIVITVSMVLLFLCVSWILYSLFSHNFIEQMYYEGKSIKILGKTIVLEGQDMPPLEYYLKLADRCFIIINIVIILCLLLFLFFLLFLSSRYLGAIFICCLILITASIMHTFFSYCVPLSGNAWGAEDAYITYRYAYNFFRGHGLVYNIGERVEGYSTLLYSLLISFGYVFFRPENIYFYSVFLNLFFAVISLVVFYKYVKKRLGVENSAIASFLFVLCPSIWLWTISGMETIVVLFIQLMIWTTAEQIIDDPKPRNILTLCIAIVFSILARADGFILPVIAIMYLLFKGKRKIVWYFGISAILTFVLHRLFAYNYYGYFLPNTYYVKVAGPLMARFRYAIVKFIDISLHQGLWVYLLIFLFSLIEALKRANYRLSEIFQRVKFSVLFVACWFLYWMYIGGDYYEERFLIFIFPLGIFALLEFIGQNIQKEIKLFLIILVAMIQLSSLYFLSSGRMKYKAIKYDCLITLGKFLKDNYHGKTLAICAAGKVPYYSGLKTIDMLGLNDEFIAHKKIDHFYFPAHNKFDADYVLSRKPDLIVATWIRLHNMDLETGLTMDKYESNYRLKYFINDSLQGSSVNIIDVSDFSEEDIVNLKNRKYKFVVLEKKEEI